MRVDSNLRKFELYAVAVVAAVVVLQFAFVFSGPFVAEDFSVSSAPSKTSSSTSAPADTDSQQTPPEPALRVLDGVVSHG
jgi:hypothetical protein